MTENITVKTKTRNSFNSYSKLKLSINTFKRGKLELNSDIVSSLINNRNNLDIENKEYIHEQMEIEKKKENVKAIIFDKDKNSSFLKEKFYNDDMKNKINIIPIDKNDKNDKYDSSQINHSKELNIISIKKNEKKCKQQSLNNNYNTNSLYTEKFDRSYSSLIDTCNRKHSIYQNSSNLTNISNDYIKSNTRKLENKFNSKREFQDSKIYIKNIPNINHKNKICVMKDNIVYSNPFLFKENEENEIINNDRMFVTCTYINGKIGKLIPEKENLFDNTFDKNIIYDRNRKIIKTDNPSIILKDPENLLSNKSIEDNIDKKKEKIEYFGIGSQYHKISPFDFKFNRDLSKLSRNYGKIESKIKFTYGEKYSKLIDHSKDLETYKNMKLLKDRTNYKFKLLPLINTKKNLFDVLAKNFFSNLKTQRESKDYCDIEKEFEDYYKNKNDKIKNITIFEEEMKNIK